MTLLVLSAGVYRYAFQPEPPGAPPPAQSARTALAAPNAVEPTPGNSAEATIAKGPLRLLRALRPGRSMPGESEQGDIARAAQFDPRSEAQRPSVQLGPREEALTRGGTFEGDVRTLPMVVRRHERVEREGPEARPRLLPGSVTEAVTPPPIVRTTPAPATIANFDGLDFAHFGAGHPPDTNGDVGPNHYIQTVNTAVGIYRKTDGLRLAAFTFDSLMSQGNFGNLCDTDNFGDPVVLYDTFEDRWIITDFAFQLDGSQNVVNPPGMFQCFAVSKSGDPVSGGWNFYSINTTGGLGDYGKFAIWPDGLYMSVNMFDYAASGGFQNVRLYAFNKAQMYAGAPAAQSVSFDLPSSEFTLLPANARLQTGTPPAGSPNYFASVWNYLNVVSVWKFHADWNSISTSTLTGPFDVLTPTSWTQYSGASGLVPSPANSLDTLRPRLMVQNQYSNIGGVESLWDSHTVGAAAAAPAQAAVRYYQVDVTGGTVAGNSTQAYTYSPDATLHRFMVSGAVDRQGDLALGYSTSNASTYPGIRYAGRLAGDPPNTITYTESSVIEGTGSQTATTRWGDYSAMTLDVDGCTFWYTNEYYAAPNSGNNLTRIASFKFPECTPATTGTLTGTVRSTGSGTPAIAGATVALGSRTATTNASGGYTFSNLPVGTYPSLTASAPGFVAQTVTGVTITQGATTTRDFSLSAAPTSGCFTDTTLNNFQTGVSSNCDMTTSPGNIMLVNTPAIDQQNTSVTNSGYGITSTSWVAQTFTAGVTGAARRVDLDLFCYQCTGTTPNLTVSIRATSAGLPSGADLATATIAGFSSGAGGFYSATFASAATLTMGTQYAVVVRPVSNPSAGLYAYVVSSGSQYSGGSRVTSANGGSNWVADATTDLGFKVYMDAGFAHSGSFISSVKDANPASGVTPTWNTISWTASVPGGAALQFQAAASNNVNGPFNFVGPNGTASTYFTSGASLAQFNGMRYLMYKAVFTSTTGAASPTLNDVTVCFTALGSTPPSISTQPQGQTMAAGQTATLTVVASGTPTLTYQWYVGTSGTTTSPIGGATSSSYTTPALTQSTNYWVRVSNGGGSANSQTAAVKVYQPFTDATLVAGTTPMRVVHITELRSRINTQRQRFGLLAFVWTNATLTANVSVISATDVTELRTALSQAYVAAGLTAPTFTDSSLAAGTTPIKLVHITELRNALIALEVH